MAGQGDILSEYDDPASGVAALVPETGRIGVAGLRHVMSSWEAERLAAALPQAELVDVSAQVASVKAVKDPEDIEELRATAAIADTAFEAFLERLCARRDAAGSSRARSSTSSAPTARGTRWSSSAPARTSCERPTAEPVAPGDLLTVFVEIVGPTGYWIELGRLVAVGELDAKREQLAETCLAAARAAEGELVAGRTAGDPARAIDAVAEAAGLRRRHLARPRGRRRPRPAGDHGGRRDVARSRAW